MASTLKSAGYGARHLHWHQINAKQLKNQRVKHRRKRARNCNDLAPFNSSIWGRTFPLTGRPWLSIMRPSLILLSP